jgi:hypothetical protein
VNTVAVKRSVSTVNHDAPREAITDMTLARRRLLVTRTTGVRPFGRQERPGGAASERGPHWSNCRPSWILRTCTPWLWPTGSGLAVGLLYPGEGAVRRNAHPYCLGAWLALTSPPP